MVLSIPPSRAVSFVVGQVKGSSSHGLAASLPPWISNVWQEGYGIFSFGKRDLAPIIAYVKSQDYHHADHELQPDWERWDTPLPATTTEEQATQLPGGSATDVPPM